MRSFIILALGLIAPWLATAGEWDGSGQLAVEGRWFVDDPAFHGQLDGAQASFLAEPEWEWQSAKGSQQLSLHPFLRLDGEDDERTHVDLREAYWRFIGDDWELLAGANRVFWGVAESRHLVDVINQVDAVEDIDEEDRLGQPMVQAAFQRPWGRIEAFGLLGFRGRTFPGEDGRLRTPIPVDTDAARYESGARSRRLDGALRWSHYLGDWDLGAHIFHGTGREPRLLPDRDGDRLIPHYDVTTQAGIDVQYTREAWLYKLEALGREGQGDDFAALVGGFEYTLYQIGGSAADLGLLAEYLHDGRDGDAPSTIYDDDLFVGSRLALNDTQDTQVLVGAILDRDDGTVVAFLEAERRLGSHYTIELESRWLLDVDEENVVATFEQDGFVTIRFSRYF
jgi:hypothetical protein